MGTDYDWRKCEAKLNALPQFMTEIDGLDIHFIHVRSKHENALPLIVTHGWPGSIIEQLKIIDPLTDPTAHGGSASDAFHVVIPSMPGYGFSGKPTSTGWGPERMGRAWAELMKRLGYTATSPRAATGVRSSSTRWACRHPRDCSPSTPTCLPPFRPTSTRLPWPATRRHPVSQPRNNARTSSWSERSSKSTTRSMMAARPQTLYGIADSPVGLAAWLLDHNDADGQPAAAVASALNRTTSATGELTRDEILDNITLYWLTNTGVSASRLYWEYKGGFFNAKGVSIPVAVTVFPGEQYEAPRSWTERAYPNLIYFNEVDKGGHFAAWEQPELFAARAPRGVPVAPREEIRSRPPPPGCHDDRQPQASVARTSSVEHSGRETRRPSPTHRGYALAHARSSSKIGRRACSWRRCRSSPATGRPSTTGASARRGSTRCRSSRPRSTASTSTSSTSGRSTRTRCR